MRSKEPTKAARPQPNSLPTGPLAALRIDRTIVMHGANWMARASVAVAILSGGPDLQTWKAVLLLAKPLRPPGMPESDDPQPPETVAQAVERLACLICSWCYLPPGKVERTAFGQTASRAAVLPLQCEAVTLGALRLAADLVRQATMASPDEGWSEQAAARMKTLRDAAVKWLPKSRIWIARAAAARNVPWRPVTGFNGVLLLGEGRHGIRLSGTLTQRAGKMAVDLATNKRSGNLCLARAGIPVARQVPVQDLAGAAKAVSAVGLPMVMKPIDTQRQTGISFVYRPDEVEAAFAYTSAHGSSWVAESFLPGTEYRLLVCQGEVIAAFERPPPGVVGDGVSTIAELVERENASPDRGRWVDGFNLHKLVLDARSHALLRHQGWSVSSVPPAGRIVQTHPLPFVGVGGGNRIDATDRIHSDNLALASRAVGILGLDVGGVDFRTPDISRSWKEVGAGLCEVNAQPDLSAHYLPGLEGDFAGRFLDRIYPPSERGGMIHVLLVGRGDLSAHAMALRDALRDDGRRVGMAIPGRPVELDGFPCALNVQRLADAYAVTVEDPTLDAGVYVATADHVAWHGAGAPRLDVAMIEEGDDQSTKLARHALDAAAAQVIPLPGAGGDIAAILRGAMLARKKPASNETAPASAEAGAERPFRAP